MKRLALIIVPIILILLGTELFAVPLNFIKKEKQELKQLKRHPLEDKFNKPLLPEERKRGLNRVLVLLIEFNDDELLEDNPQTTGNGKFQQDPEGYPITLGKPPHNHDYFEMQLEALKKYYKAASLYFEDGFREYGLNIDYDIFPQPGPNGEHLAYDLPNSMSYYNPGQSDYELLVSRFEDYFQHSFIRADQDENIDFSLYDHFILVHAGSDWQHDVNGDTPSDIPSFFIRIGDGKEVIVDDNIEISYACNVPETISQDISISSDNIPNVSGYGLINAVIAHEFGHSLGFVDLYNVKNNYPIVGYYDIMDSGGMGRLTFPVNIAGDVDYENAIAYYDLEGCLPVLPGAWSRVLVWEDEFRNRGYLKDLSELNLGEEIVLNPASKKPKSALGKPYFIKIPLNDHEYVLLENRQIDPDGDGGTAVQSSEDKRVILYPTPISDTSLDSFTYEYDFLLPGWFKPSGEAMGGGILAWHIDNNLLYENNNFNDNTVNTSLAERSVKIIEADNIHDLGNPYAPSWAWRGTEYDSYFKFKPILDENGNFLNWDIDYSDEGQTTTHNDELSSTSEPALLSNSGNPSIYSINSISSYPININETRNMSLRIGINLYDECITLAYRDSIKSMGYIGNSFGFPGFPMFTPGVVDFYSLVGNQWIENPLSSAVNIDFNPAVPVVSFNYLLDDNQAGNEFIIAERNSLFFLNPLNSDTNPPFSRSFGYDVTDAPIYIENSLTLVTPTTDYLYINQDSLSINNAKCAYNGNILAALSDDKLYLIDPENPQVTELIVIPESTGGYYPVFYEDYINSDYSAIFFQSETGNVYKYDYNRLEKIFNLYPYQVENPTQLALGNPVNEKQIHLAFGAEDKVFVMDIWGTLLPEFPFYIQDKNFFAQAFPRILKIYDTSILLMPENEGGYVAIDFEGNYRADFSYFWNSENKMSQYFWDEANQALLLFHIDSANTLFASKLENIISDPIIWEGYRNGGYSLFVGEQTTPISQNEDFIVSVYPNPVKNGEVKFRLENSNKNIDLQIFDIAGNLVYSRHYSNVNPDVADLNWETKKIASGIYFGIIKSGNNKKKVPIAIIN